MPRRIKPFAPRVASLLLASALLPLVAEAAPPPAPTAPPKPAATPTLQILSDATLPPALQWAVDVRWASDKTVYLALGRDGAVEASVAPAGGSPQQLIPGKSTLGGFWASWRIASSSRFLVVAGPALSLTWRTLANPVRTEEAFEVIEAVDVREDRLALVGTERGDNRAFAPEGAIAWVGAIDKGVAGLKPILYDLAGPGAPSLDRCIGTGIAAIRFLADGSLLVAPGVQPGISLLDSQGKLLRTWDTTALGIDADCGSLTMVQATHFSGHPMERRVWVNQRRTVDAILPLQQGPALVVRRVEQGHTRWDLKILRRDGSVATYAVPFEGSNEFFNLRGDVREGKIVFLLREVIFRESGKDHPAPPRLILSQPPT